MNIKHIKTIYFSVKRILTAHWYIVVDFKSPKLCLLGAVFALWNAQEEDALLLLTPLDLQVISGKKMAKTQQPQKLHNKSKKWNYECKFVQHSREFQ